MIPKYELHAVYRLLLDPVYRVHKDSKDVLTKIFR